MRKVAYLLVFFVLLAALAACGGGEEPPPAIEEQEIESALEAPPPPTELPPEEPVVEPQLPAHLQYIVDAGEFGGPAREGVGFSTYTNAALNIIYHLDEESASFVIHAGRVTEELMRVYGYKDWFWLIAIAGSGEEWVRQRVDEFVETYIEDWLEESEHIREWVGDEFEEWLAQQIQWRDEREQRWAEHSPEIPFEESINPFTPDELDMVRFWPVEYEIAGRQFSGLQINVVWPGSGFNVGRTYLFHQLDDDTALVMSIDSEEMAGYVARRHISRFAAIS